MRGRKPKPTALKKLAGNPGKRKLPKEPPFRDASADGARPPTGLPRRARWFWKTYYPMLQTAGVMKETDLPAFDALCRSYANYRKADAEANKPGGMIQVTEGGYEAPSGWVVLRGKFYQEMKQLMEHFGLTPISRSRVKVDASAGEMKDPFAEFMGGPAVIGKIGLGGGAA